MNGSLFIELLTLGLFSHSRAHHESSLLTDAFDEKFTWPAFTRLSDHMARLLGEHRCP